MTVNNIVAVTRVDRYISVAAFDSIGTARRIVDGIISGSRLDRYTARRIRDRIIIRSAVNKRVFDCIINRICRLRVKRIGTSDNVERNICRIFQSDRTAPDRNNNVVIADHG